MLKIKDNVDLKELEKFGLKPKYNENTGEICAYIKEIDKFEGLIFKQEQKIIRFYKKQNGFWINKFYDYFDVDTLYDLIQAGLVEKVGG